MTSINVPTIIDTNILVYASNTSSLYYKKADSFIAANCSYLMLSNQNINEYLRVVTHKVYPNPLSIGDALHNIIEYKRTFNRYIIPNLKTHETFIRLLKKYSVTSNQIFDSYLVALAVSNNVFSLATLNSKHFSNYSEISIIQL